MTDFFSNILSGIQVSETNDVTDFIDTGSYTFNALISGSIYKGFAMGRIIGLAGETQTGKTYFALSATKEFLRKYPNGGVIYIDTEQAISPSNLRTRGIEPARVKIVSQKRIETIIFFLAKMIDNLSKMKPEDRPPMMVVLDSLGNIASSKELKDVLSENDVRDMTRSQMIKKFFRIVTVEFGELNIPCFITNHVYDNISGYGDPKKAGGGSGFQYLTSTVCFLSRAKHKDAQDGDVTGIKLTLKTDKSRFSKPYQKVETLLNFETGINRYYGLLDLAENYGIVKKLSKQYEMPDGSKHFEKTIYNNPERFFTKDILDRIDEGARKQYGFRSEEEDLEKIVNGD